MVNIIDIDWKNGLLLFKGVFTHVITLSDLDCNSNYVPNLL